MKKLLTTLILLTTFLVSCVPIFAQNAVKHTNEPIQAWTPNEAYKSIGKIYSKVIDEPAALSATAFAVSPDALLTANHFCAAVEFLRAEGILEDEIYLDIYGLNNQIVTLKGLVILETNAVDDLCLIGYNNHGLLPVVLADAIPPIHSSVYIAGAPLGLFAAIEEGKIIGKCSFGGAFRNKLCATAPVIGGFSGSPVFNEDGRCVGLLIAGHETYDHLSIITPLNRIVLFLKIVGVK